MTDNPDRLPASLSASLYGLSTPVGDLPLGGYAPPDGQWHPRPAAVLVPVLVFDRPEILLTVRSAHLSRHAGQVAFPGGGREPADGSVVATALRETREETGIAETLVRPLGYLGRYDTITGYRMTAVVGCIEQPPELLIDRTEVEAVFTVALEHVLDPGNYQVSKIRHRGVDYRLLTLRHPDYRIWGATAALLDALRQRLSRCDVSANTSHCTKNRK